MADPAELARAAFDRMAWNDVRAHLAVVPALDPEDLERLAVASHLAGHGDEASVAWERAHAAYAERGDADAAARCAGWIGVGALLRGDVAVAGGWLARAEQVLDDARSIGPSRGLLLVPRFLEALVGRDVEHAAAIADELADLGDRFDHDDLRAFGRLAQGQTALARGDPSGAMRRLDEVMVRLMDGGVSPIVAGIVYCAAIECCMELGDIRRATEWTDRLHRWCDAQPDLVPYRGQCLVHRSQVFQAHGDWSSALQEVQRAQEWLSRPPHPALALAHYQRGELHRLRGELDQAEQAYRAASEQALDPAPGLALLRLAQGRADAAVATVRRMVEEHRGQVTAPTMLAAAVEILVETGHLEEAATTAAELHSAAAALAVPVVRTHAARAEGAVLLAQGVPARALAPLRRACAGWRDLDNPYELARTRILVALACRAVGDDDAAALELDTARAEFARLGARPDVARVDALGTRPPPVATSPLTERECEVLRLVAAGHTNREIAGALVISEHTVARHLQNIFAKLDVSSRSAATAYAYQHGLV